MVNRVKSIRLASENITYIFPPELQQQELHNNLFTLNTIKNACKLMSKRGQFRNISVTMPEEIIPLYFNEEKNVVFNEIYLEEENTALETATTEIHQDDLKSLVKNLSVRIDERENREPSLNHIQKNFILDKFGQTEC